MSLFDRIRRAWRSPDLKPRSYMENRCAQPANVEKLVFLGDPAAREGRARLRKGSRTF